MFIFGFKYIGTVGFAIDQKVLKSYAVLVNNQSFSYLIFFLSSVALIIEKTPKQAYRGLFNNCILTIFQ